MVWNSILLFFHTHFPKHRENGVQLNKKPMESITPLQNGIIISRGADIVVRNDPKPLNRFLNAKNANNKVNRWGQEIATYNITFEWISGACNKPADCLSHLVKLPQATPVPINMLSVTNSNGPPFNTRSQTCQCLSPDTSTSQPDIRPEVSEVPDPTPKSLTADRLEALLQM